MNEARVVKGALLRIENRVGTPFLAARLILADGGKDIELGSMLGKIAEDRPDLREMFITLVTAEVEHALRTAGAELIEIKDVPGRLS